MSDLHFTIEDHSDMGKSGGVPQRIAPHEVPMAGEMDHLPHHQPAAGSVSSPAEKSTFEYMQEQLKASSHPNVVIFHILFKALALFFYIFGGWFMPSSTKAGSSDGNFITLTVIIILLLAADFWVTKNVTGRLLVGLRWWNKVNEDSTTWIFESAEQGDGPPKQINPFDKNIFWTVLYATPFVWLAMLLLSIVRIQINWLLVCFMALALSCSNVYGYYKCSSDQRARFQQLVNQGAQQGAMAVVRTNMLSVLTGQTSGGTLS